MEFGWSELLVIGIVALIVVGPKDLPGMFRQLGKFTAKVRRMAREFQRAMEDAADESGMKETASSLRKMTSAKEMGLDAVRDAAKGWDSKASSDKAKKAEPKKADTETGRLSEERAEQAKKIREYSAQKAQERLDAEKAAAEAAEAKDAPAATTPEPRSNES